MKTIGRWSFYWGYDYENDYGMPGRQWGVLVVTRKTYLWLGLQIDQRDY